MKQASRYLLQKLLFIFSCTFTCQVLFALEDENDSVPLTVAMQSPLNRPHMFPTFQEEGVAQIETPSQEEMDLTDAETESEDTDTESDSE